MEEKQTEVLNSGLPRWLTEAATVIMILSAICSWHDIQVWLNVHCPFALALAQNVGMVVMYYAVKKSRGVIRDQMRPCFFIWSTVVSSWVYHCLPKRRMRGSRRNT